MKPVLTAEDYNAAAEPYGIDPLYLRAVAEVESAGNGFLDDGRPKILFEGHIFWRRLRARKLNPESILKLFPEAETVLYPKWTKKHYVGGSGEHDRLDLATRLGDISAYESASWGKFQVMGYHAKRLGYEDAQVMAGEMYQSEAQHLEAFVRYCKVYGLIDELQRQDHEGFARGYNGPGFAQNRYDEKIEKAYRKLRRGAV